MSTNNTQHTAAYQIVGAFIKVNDGLTNLGTISRVAHMQLNDPDQPHALMAWSDSNSYPAIMYRSSDRQEIEERFKEVSSLVLKQKKRKFIRTKKLLVATDLIAGCTPIVKDANVWISISLLLPDTKPLWVTCDSKEELDEDMEAIERQLSA